MFRRIRQLIFKIIFNAGVGCEVDSHLEYDLFSFPRRVLPLNAQCLGNWGVREERGDLH